MKHERFDVVTNYTADTLPPDKFVALVERRVGGMVRAYAWHQEYRAANPGLPRAPTLLDIVVSAYLQGANDVVQTAIERDLFREEPR